MKKKTIIIIIAVLLVIIAAGLICYFTRNTTPSTYEIRVDLVDDKSPDRTLVVLKDGKETKDYKYIRYSDGVILCYQKNSTVNMYEIDSDELIVVLLDDTEVNAKIIRNDKE